MNQKILNPSAAKRWAKRHGAVRYHGKPCKTCSNTERYTCSSTCVHCNFTRNKKIREQVIKSE